MNLEPGQLVVRRQFQRDALLSRVWVGRAVAVDERGLWLWVASGSAYRDIAAADGRAFREVPFRDWGKTDKALRALTWNGDMLLLHPADGAHSVWFFFSPTGEFRGWYINLEEPSAWWQADALTGIDTVDYDLDLVVSPDRGWRWKDEAEFADHLAHPDTYWVPDADAVRAEGQRLAAIVEAGEFPFDGTRTGFRPDPSWTVPLTMPPGWDRPRAPRSPSIRERKG